MNDLPDGVHRGVPNSTYQSLPRVSSSQLKEARKSIAGWKRKYLDGVKEERKDHFVFGDLVHCLVLDPHTFDDRFVVTDRIDKRNTATKKLLAECERAGKSLISQGDMRCAEQMSLAIQEHPVAGTIFQGGEAELSAFATDPATGLTLKARCDYLRHDRYGDGVVFDLKTAKDASSGAFARDAGNFGYHLQDPFYLDVLSLASGKKIVDFWFVVVEKTEPYQVAVYRLSDEARELGRQVYRQLLQRIKYYRDREEYPGLNYDRAIEIDLPRYIYSQTAEEFGL